MKFSKKAILSTLAIGVTAASLSNVPLGTVGYVTGFGVQKVAAAGNFDLVTGKLNAVYQELSKSANGLAALRALRDDLQGISQSEFETALEPVLAKLPNSVSSTTLYNLFKDAANLTYDPSYEALKSIRSNSDYVEAAKAIGAAGGISDLTVDDLVTFSIAAENQMVNSLGQKTLTQLLALLENADARNGLLRDSYRQALNLPTGSGSLGQALSNLQISENDVAASVQNVQGLLDAAIVKNAFKQLGLAYIAAEGIALPGENPNPGNPDPGTPNPGIPGGGAAGGGGGAAGGGAVPPVVAVPPVIVAPDVLDVSGSVTITNGIAVVALNEEAVLNVIKALPSGTTTLTLDLKNVAADSISVPISQAILNAAKAAGVANIAVVVNGLTLSLPINQFDGSLALSIEKKADSEVTSLTTAPLASDVYEFGLKVADRTVSAFRDPLLLQIPIRNKAGLDLELLTLVKFSPGGKLDFQGGKVSNGVLTEMRNSFSTYAVVENKVSFNDVAKVQAWAGRQIAVVAAKGAVEGKAAGIFAPQDNVTRAEFAKMLVRAFDFENQFASAAFNDVKPNQWFAEYVASAADKGVITGRSEAQFAPQDSITRAEMATMVSRAVKLAHNLDNTVNVDAALSQFSDASQIPASLKEGTAFATANNLVIGNNGKFAPKGTATRAEAAVILYRAMNFKSNQ